VDHNYEFDILNTPLCKIFDMERKMFYDAPASIFKKAAMLRRNQTPHERLLWDKLKANQILGLRFKPQHPIELFIVDFYCHRCKLVIEIDGDSHLRKEELFRDQIKTESLTNLGLTILRFTNEDVENNIDSVIRRLIDRINVILHAAQL
jgi:very-short-patch-repair endonuclease